MRRRVFDIIEVDKTDDRLSQIYDIYMMLVIVVSLLPLAFKEPPRALQVAEQVTVSLYCLDYLLRLWTADYKLEKGKKSFFIYPFTPMAIVDILSILPSLQIMHRAFTSLRLLRLFRTLRVLRLIKSFRYSRNIELITRVFVKQKDSLLVVCWLALGYIIASALIVFNVEPDTFPTFFDAVYWATVSLTTVGYGDIYAVSAAGRLITMLSSLFGVAIVALPAGILTAGYMDELAKEKQRWEERKEKRRVRVETRKRIVIAKREEADQRRKVLAAEAEERQEAKAAEVAEKKKILMTQAEERRVAKAAEAEKKKEARTAKAAAHKVRKAPKLAAHTEEDC